jgi:hypothetical protein
MRLLDRDGRGAARKLTAHSASSSPSTLLFRPGTGAVPEQYPTPEWFFGPDNMTAGMHICRRLRFLPADKPVILGLFSSKTAGAEDLDEIRRRIEATRYVDINRIGITPQCGFASTVGGNPVTPESQRDKLSQIAALAAEIWGTDTATEQHDHRSLGNARERR